MSQQKTSYPDMTSRQNPQFKQTTMKYLNHKKQRKQLQKRKHLFSNQVKHYQKINHSLSKSLQQKQHELNWLKKVRQRYLTEMHQKKCRQEQQKLKLQQLRLYNTTIRQKSIQNINDALKQLHKKKTKAHNEVNNTMKHLKQIYLRKKSITDQANQSLFLEVKRSRIKCKNRVNKFFQKKNTQLTRYYKSMAEYQQEAFVSGVRQIQQLHDRQSTYKQKIAKKQAKMSKILNQIEQIKRSSVQIAASNMRSSRYTDTKSNNRSKISRTQRTQNFSDGKNSIGFKLTNVGSTQFIEQGSQIK